MDIGHGGDPFSYSLIIALVAPYAVWRFRRRLLHIDYRPYFPVRSSLETLTRPARRKQCQTAVYFCPIA
jgi:hypothetical protein